MVTDLVKPRCNICRQMIQDNMIVGEIYHSTLECMKNVCFCASTYTVLTVYLALCFP